ncbi:hypothetical protein BH11PLA2_BH11PLA2_47360 [soil metagenome]
MPRVVLAPALARWLTATPGSQVNEVTLDVVADTVREALDAVFAIYPQIRSYVVDEHGTLRHHVMAWLDGMPVTDKQNLLTPLSASSELFLFQALSGG